MLIDKLNYHDITTKLWTSSFLSLFFFFFPLIFLSIFIKMTSFQFRFIYFGLTFERGSSYVAQVGIKPKVFLP